ncbi:MAG: hypothetical protein KatS3mg110_0085 [Pirellulaceae bacterium]|nr:MAG: hypothetical protein KatS3mg110_0085 [Pirellulaceae bacterium]
MQVEELRRRLPNAALAFRGYNVTNLGRTAELLEDARYSGIMEEALQEASRWCREAVGRPVDLVRRVRQGQETTLECYDEAVALVVGTSIGQLRALAEVWKVDYRRARLAFGYSLGELSALIACGLLPAAEGLRIPIGLAADSVALAHDARLAVVFSKTDVVAERDVQRLCQQINLEGNGTIGISAILTPNTLLVIGQGQTVARFRELAAAALGPKVMVHENRHRWPPLHTPIVWQRCIADRAAHQMLRMPVLAPAPKPPVLSLVTGQVSYEDYNCREILHRWVDHPQRLWDAVYQILALGIELVIHVGPQPNIIPATLQRLADNVRQQTAASLGMRALSHMVRRPWLHAILPRRASLLRAPLIEQITLEDWLLAQPR